MARAPSDVWCFGTDSGLKCHQGSCETRFIVFISLGNPGDRGILLPQNGKA